LVLDRPLRWLPSTKLASSSSKHPIPRLPMWPSSLLPFLPVRLLMKDQFRSDERIDKVTAPLLVMHGERDQAIAIRFGERLFALAHEPKRFVRFPQGRHEDLDDHGAIKVVRRFIYE